MSRSFYSSLRFETRITVINQMERNDFPFFSFHVSNYPEVVLTIRFPFTNLVVLTTLNWVQEFT